MSMVYFIMSMISAPFVWFVGFLADLFGVSRFRIVLYMCVAVVVFIGLLVVRHHYVMVGVNKTIAKIEKQNGAARDAAKEVSKKTAQCSDTNGYWDVITQGCRLGDDDDKEVVK